MTEKIKICVLIKQVPIPSRMKETKDGFMDRSVSSMMNPYCKHALEVALQLKDKLGENKVEVCVASMGPQNFEQSHKEALAMGADKTFLLSDRALAGSDTYVTSMALSKTIENKGDLSVILFGLQTIDGDTGHVGPQVAERLGIPHVSYVTGIEYKEDHLIVERLSEKGSITYEVPIPCLLAITNISNVPRGPRLKYAIRSRKQKTMVYTIADVGLKAEDVGTIGSPTAVSGVKKIVNTRPPCQIIEGSSVEEKASNLLSKISKDWDKMKED
ncbi:MAG: electron transfer flavoprotein subunit beta/FixA family protein [Candidatus Kariarchaeaceae archaeon]